MNQGLGKSSKLKSKRHIDLLFTEGQNVKSYPLKLIYVPLENAENEEIKAGFSVPKKLVSTAVRRNRIKRLLREVFRKNKYLVDSQITSAYAFMFIYISREDTDYQSMEKSMKAVLRKFGEKI